MSDALAEQILEQVLALRAQVTELRASKAREIPDHPMSPKEVAAVVGKTEKTVRKWVADGDLKVRHIGRVMLITPDALRRFLAQ